MVITGDADSHSALMKRLSAMNPTNSAPATMALIVSEVTNVAVDATLACSLHWT